MHLVKIPGLIDPHVHLRDPGQTEKEDFTSGTKAAIAGGFTTVLDMPNNKLPVFSNETLDNKKNIATEKIVCDIGFYFGTTGDNLEEFERVKDKVFGLKVYLNKTTGNLITDKEKLLQIFKSWPDSTPVLLHAVDETLDFVISVLKETPRPIHICHVSSKYELSKIIEAKKQNLPITCGVTPHHLFLTETDQKNLGPYGLMQPPLRSEEDLNFIWDNLNFVDVIESDHAPHTKAEKEVDENIPFGVPGLETTLFLLLAEVKKGKITLKDVIRLCHANSQKIFRVGKNDSAVEIDLDHSWIINNDTLQTKSHWTPFAGCKVNGKIISVTLRGKTIYEHGKYLSFAGDGKVVTPEK